MKKNSIPAILIWAFYSLMSGSFLFLVMLNVCGESGMGPGAGLAAGAGVLAVLGVFSFLTARFGPKLGAMLRDDRKNGGSGKKYFVSLVIEGILALLLLLFMVLVRTKYAADAYPWYVNSDMEFQLAQIPSGTGMAEIPNIAHRGRELYVYLLRGFCFLLGNKPETAVVLQLALLVTAALCLYFAVRKSAGRIPAVLVLVFLGFTPYMLEVTCDPSAFLLMAVFYGLALHCILGIRDLQKTNKVLQILYYTLTGICIGFCCYLDMTGITLLIFLTGELCFYSTEESTESGPLFAFLVCLAAGILGYLACHAIRGSIDGGLAASLNAQLGIYLPQNFLLPGGYMESVSWDRVVLAVLLAAGVFTFWVDHRIRTKGIWFFAIFLLILMQGFQMGNQEYFNTSGFLYLMCVVIAGINFEYLKRWVYTSNLSGAKQAVSGGGDFEMQQIEKPEELEVEIMDQEDKNSGEHSDFRYIENPLPLPKKREHKLMDYDYDVSEDDDFDIP